MTNELASANRIAAPATDSPFTPLGLVLREGLSFDEWAGIGTTLGTIEQGINWWIGDWLNYGERAYGEKYAQAVQETGRDRDTLANIASIAGKFEISRRRDNLSWSHHAEVAALPLDQQDSLLDQAERERWSKTRLREAVQASRKAIPSATPSTNGTHPSTNGNGAHPPADALSTSDDEVDGDGFDAVEALESAQGQILRLQAERDSLRTSDKDTEISRLHDQLARVEALRVADQNKLLEQERIIKGQRRHLDSAAKLLGVLTFGEIVPAIQGLLNRSGR